jgi:hypothetical protein
MVSETSLEEETMDIWKSLWCFYNSTAFAPVASIGLLGAWGLIVPALATLPKRSDTREDRLKLYILFNKARRWVIVLGLLTLACSLISPMVYMFVLTMMGGETCKVETPPADIGMAYFWLIVLYIATLITLALSGGFYLRWQDTLKQHEVIKG